MSIIVNGTTIPTNGVIKYNGTDITKVICNTTTVWTKANKPSNITTPLEAKYVYGQQNTYDYVYYNWYSSAYDLTGVSSITITFDWYYYDEERSEEEGEYNYWACYRFAVGISKDKVADGSGGISVNKFDSYQIHEAGKATLTVTETGTKTVTINTSSLSGNYYIGASVYVYDSYYNTTIKSYNEQYQTCKITSVVFN